MILAFVKKWAGWLFGVLALLLPGAGLVIHLRAKKQGAREERLEQVEHAEAIEEENRAAELADEDVKKKRDADLEVEVVHIEEVAEEQLEHPPATLSAAKKEQTNSRTKLSQLERAGLLRRKP